MILIKMKLDLLDTIPPMCSLEYWKGIIQNGIGCTLGSFLAIFASYRIYLSQNRRSLEEKEQEIRQQNADTISYFKSIIKDTLSIVDQQIQELENFIEKTRANSITIDPLTYLPLFQLKRLIDGDSVDLIFAAYQWTFPGKSGVQEFSDIMDTIEYLYSQLLQFPDESK